MKLTFIEEVLLSLYLEYFDKEYDVSNDKLINIKRHPILERHNEMQNVLYIVKETAAYSEEYSFTWNWLGPYSPGLEIILNELDKKNESINSFYEEYNLRKSKYFNNYKDQLKYLLSKYCSDSCIEKIALSSFVFKNIFKRNNGSQATAQIIYVSKNVVPGEDLETVLDILQERNFDIDIDMAKEIWKNMDIRHSIDRNKKLKMKME